MITHSTSIEFIPKPGDRIDDNVVIAEIAEGGMARVYKVKNEALEVIRVLKLLKLSSNIDNDRFVTEARISANLNHPNIIQCYRFGKFKDRIPYIEMEYVDGVSLYHLINSNGKIPIPVVLSVTYYICKALQALHTCSYTLYDAERFGVVHRDIKPANILISRKGEVKLADFGIAKPRDLSIHTSAVQVVGSIFYLSPEQLRKDDLDFRSDIYSLGCVIYEMITAKKAFDQGNISDIVVAKINNSYAESRLKGCSERLKSAIVTCLNPVKADRFETIDGLLQEIELELKGYEIDNPQDVIRRYVQHPGSFLSLDSQESHRFPRKALLLPLFVILTIVLLFSSILLLKRNPFGTGTSSVQEAPLAEPQSALQALSPADVEDSIARVIDSITQKKSVQAKNAEKRQGPSQKEKPALSQKVITEQSMEQARMAFMRRQYSTCIDLLSPGTALTDILFLCLLGSLAETGNFARMAKLCKTRTVNDGYYHYCMGRLHYHKKEYDTALKDFLKALTIPSFYRRLSYYANYYIAKSKTALYLQTPNIVNKNVMLKSFDRFTAHFCENSAARECLEIRMLTKKYK